MTSAAGQISVANVSNTDDDGDDGAVVEVGNNRIEVVGRSRHAVLACTEALEVARNDDGETAVAERNARMALGNSLEPVDRDIADADADADADGVDDVGEDS